MGQRLWWAVLVLGAVFAMHGVQCMTIDSMSAGHGTVVAAPAQHVHSLVGDHVADPAGPTAPRSVAGQPLIAAAAQGLPIDSSHGSAGHSWEVCLAVLAAGLALGLGALVKVLSRPVAWTTQRTGGRFAATRGWLAPIRPPNLSALCLLRI